MKKWLFLIMLVFSLFGLQKCKGVEIGNSTPDKKSTDTTTFSCTGKTQCGEMTSCAEAMYYLKNCPNVQIDGDNDGIPCEGQWCGN